MRAAAAERVELERHRRKLVEKRGSLRAELDRIEAALADVDERARLLERLAGPGRTDSRGGDPDGETSDRHTVLRGPAIRTAAVRLLNDHPDHPEALHYRQWFELLLASGVRVAGKDPLAVFLTQISRSPVVRRGTQAGVYELDRSAPRRLRTRLEDLHAQLRGVSATPTATEDLATVRAHRSQLAAEVARVEKALEEACTVLRVTAGDERLAAAR